MAGIGISEFGVQPYRGDSSPALIRRALGDYYEVTRPQINVEGVRKDGDLDDYRVIVAILGPQWLGNDGKPRIDDDSPVRRAFRKGISVLPVLVEGASMPTESLLSEEMRQLFRRAPLIIEGAIELNTLIARLVATINNLLGIQEPTRLQKIEAQVIKDRHGSAAEIIKESCKYFENKIFVSHTSADGSWCKEFILSVLNHRFGSDSFFYMNITERNAHEYRSYVEYSFLWCKTIVLVASRNSLVSDWVTLETNWAIGQKHPLLICRTDDTSLEQLNPGLGKDKSVPFHMIDFRDRGFDAQRELDTILQEPAYRPDPGAEGNYYECKDLHLAAALQEFASGAPEYARQYADRLGEKYRFGLMSRPTSANVLLNARTRK